MMRIRSFNNKRVEKPPLTVTSSTNSSLVQTRASWVGRVGILKAWVKKGNIENAFYDNSNITSKIILSKIECRSGPKLRQVGGDWSSRQMDAAAFQIRHLVHCSVIRIRHQVSHTKKDHLRLKSSRTERRHPLIL